MKNIKICTVVTGKTLKEFLDNLKKIQKISNFIELRTDYINNLKPEDLEVIRKNVTKESIFTCRIKEEGGFFNQDESARRNILQKAYELEFDYLDIELSKIKKWQPKRIENVKLIISYHNFNETPHFWYLNKVIFQMNQYLPNVLKISTMVNNGYDNTQLFRIMVNKPRKENRAIMGMGERGRMTRILGPLLGSYLTYASTPFSQSAPGQIGLEKLKSIYQNIANLEMI